MAVVQPFRAIRYNPSQWAGDLSSVICPPYDVLDAEDRDALLARDPKNFVAIDLPHVPPKKAGPEEAYERAQNTLGTWLREGTLIRDTEPCLYVYHQAYEYQGRTYLRKMFFAALHLERFGQGCVVPHEETFGGPKEDRLKLTIATRCNLSPIFALYTDPENQVSRAFASVTSSQPKYVATMDGVENRLWATSAPDILSAVTALMADKNVYIADGHHRYGTGLMYRDFLIEQEGTLPANHPANFVLTVLCGMEDPGCLILPTHRVLTGLDGLDAAGLLEIWAEGCDSCPPDRADVTLFDGKDEIPVRFTRPEALEELAPEKSAAWRALDLAYLHRYLIEDLLERRKGIRPNAEYHKLEAKARERTLDGGIACLTRSIEMAALRAVSDAGDLMPQKSTYFYPKLATGLIARTLTSEG